MTNNDPEFYTTADIRRMLKIGNKTCLDLFHREDFPCIKFGKSFRISTEEFKNYISTRRVFRNFIREENKNEQN